MRPFQIIVLSVFAVLAILGLILFSTFHGFGGAKPVGPVTIWGTLPSTAIQTELDDVKRTHQEFAKIVYVERPAQTFEADLSDAIASGVGPDLVLITQEQLLANQAKLAIIPFNTIPERTFRDTYLPINELFLTSQGTYGVPYVADPLVLYYNRTILSSAGVPQPPQNWETVVGLAPTLTQKSGSTIARSTIALGAYENIPNARAIISLLLLQSGSTVTEYASQGLSSTLAKSTTGTTGSSPSEGALGFYTQFADPAKVVYSWNRSLVSAQQSFIAGDSALYIGFASELHFLKSANPNLDFDMASIPQPQTATNRADYGLSYAFAIPKASKNATGAYRVAKIMTDPTEVLIGAQALDMAPAQRNLLTAHTSDIYAPIYYPLALLMQGWLSPAPGVTDGIFTAMINNIISGRMSVRESVLAADQSLNAALSH